VSQPTPVQGWSKLLLARPEFILSYAHIDEHDELVAHVEIPARCSPAPAAERSISIRCTTGAAPPSATCRSPGGPPGWCVAQLPSPTKSRRCARCPFNICFATSSALSATNRPRGKLLQARRPSLPHVPPMLRLARLVLQ
jgi:hypothetical protein